MQVPLVALLKAAEKQRADRAPPIACASRMSESSPPAEPCPAGNSRPCSHDQHSCQRIFAKSGVGDPAGHLAVLRLLAECGLCPRSGWYRIGFGGTPPAALVEAARLALLPPEAAKAFLLRARRWLRCGPPLARPLDMLYAEAPALPEPTGCPASGQPPLERPLLSVASSEDVPAELHDFLAGLLRARSAQCRAGAPASRLEGRKAGKRLRAGFAKQPPRVDHRRPCAGVADGEADTGLPVSSAAAPGDYFGVGAVGAADAGESSDEGAWRARAAAAVRASELRCWHSAQQWLQGRSSAQLVAGRCARAWRRPRVVQCRRGVP